MDGGREGVYLFEERSGVTSHHVARQTWPQSSVPREGGSPVTAETDIRRRKWQSTPVFLLDKSHGWRSLVGYSPWGCKESDTTE